MKIHYKNDEEIKIMRKAGEILRKAQLEMKKYLREGVTLLEIDKIAEDFIRREGGIPGFLGMYGFPNTICAMINSEVVHGIPDSRKLKKGDLVSIDCGVVWKKMHADAAFSVIIGGDEAHSERAKFLKCTEKALKLGCQAAKIGNRVGDIGYIIEKTMREGGYSICREYTGHGVGYELHEDPYIYNYGKPGTGVLLKKGMTIAIEPIVAMGNPKVKTLKDKWTVVTVDGKDACQCEHFGLVTEKGLDIFA